MSAQGEVKSGFEKTIERILETESEAEERAIETVLKRAQSELVEIEIQRMELQQLVSLLGAARLRILKEREKES